MPDADALQPCADMVAEVRNRRRWYGAAGLASRRPDYVAALKVATCITHAAEPPSVAVAL